MRNRSRRKSYIINLCIDKLSDVKFVSSFSHNSNISERSTTGMYVVLNNLALGVCYYVLKNIATRVKQTLVVIFVFKS